MHRTGRGFAGLNENRARLRMLLESVLDLLGTHRAAPFDLHLVRRHAIGREQLAPSLAELSAIDENGVLARLEQVGDGCFHRAGAAGGEQEDFFLGAEEWPKKRARLIEGFREFRRAVMNDRARHLEENLGWNRRRTGGEQIFFVWRHVNARSEAVFGWQQKKGWCPQMRNARPLL